VDPVGRFDAITIDCAEPLELARFWAAVFGTVIESSVGDGPHYVDLLPVNGVPILRFQHVPEPKVTKNRLHLDLSVEDLGDACSRLEVLGARQISVQATTEYGYTWTVMQDPEGNEFCMSVRA
jgi:predicted enzyme related to lactoylglutathione lyase